MNRYLFVWTVTKITFLTIILIWTYCKSPNYSEGYIIKSINRILIESMLIYLNKYFTNHGYADRKISSSTKNM